MNRIMQNVIDRIDPHREALRLRTTIEDLKHSLMVLDENLSALLAFERETNPGAHAQPLSVRNLQERRDNLTATISVLQKRLDGIN